ncbi:chromosome segregation protein SMC [Thermomonas sp.]|uniref:chromosome segregation protein SMC n=1 Tax=Thermomonas sp. TaxID=1971895 RepID=UPI002631C58C|nr:chromosome segregation protein SMC [Thermomonas sp.]
MRLSTIKLSGFKSFVDPTTLHLPTNMTGIVGPNGCGKSNIIDAIRWVMGESAASRLRGDSLTDVIFSGSSARKPVSQASVELIFDNSDHTITGEYAAFNEISVKRTVGRDGQSSYSLNGGKCRRRDITDLFLGTGLGPRSYSIIEQGMISQVIDARPEELRVYLEEAAGISKYKERRRETENRIRHTRENLDRLTDLRDEVDKQLQHLSRQARQAEQYTALQATRKEKDAQWRALEYRALDAQLQALRAGLLRDETRLEELISGQRRAESALESGRVRREAASETLNQAQAAVYEASGSLARIEQQIAHQRELATRLQRARDEAGSALDELGGQIASDSARLEALRAAVEEASPRLEGLQEDDRVRQQALRETETRLADWQQRRDAHAREQAESAKAADVERTRIEHLDRQILDADRRARQLGEERAGLDLEALTAALNELAAGCETGKTAVQELTARVDAGRAASAQVQERQRELQGEQAELRKRMQTARGRLASLETLQAAALGQEAGAGARWLQAHGLGSAARVGECLEVDSGWETAVETALGQWIEAALVDAADGVFDSALVESLAELGEGRVALVADAAASGQQYPDTSLAARVRGPDVIRRRLARVHAADDLAQARTLLQSLPAGESVITRAGECLGAGWAQVARADASRQGVLLREKDIHSLREAIEADARRETELDAELTRQRDALREAEQQREDAQRQLYLAHRNLSETSGRLQGAQGRLDGARARIERIEAEQAQIEAGLQDQRTAVGQARERLEEAVGRMAELESARMALEQEREGVAAEREAAREAARQSREAAYALSLALETQRAQMGALVQALQRMDGQRGQLGTRLQDLASQLADGGAQAGTLEGERQSALDARVQADQALAQARAGLEEIDAELRGQEQQRQQCDALALEQREAIGIRRLEQQALELKAAQFSEAIVAGGFVIETLLEQLPEEADATRWEQAVQELDGKLRRLEPVNLAAIAEHAEAAKRKEYLDAQNADLTSALETLEEAIRKIDRETRSRFKDTFDRVNAGIQELYPRLFGGGHAYLELTGEDLLDTGVTIMARPPGKRVSNISLLSGGEKAMTAVALVFSIFRLNPAPFCLLDEVDAPLDEANVGRFTTMVTEMSEAVQFLFVTHNKATMEAAHQLSGVTMREPGVSRLVSVDLAEAARLAGAV